MMADETELVELWQPIKTAPIGEFVRIRFGDDEADEYGPYVARKLGDEWRDEDGLDFGYGFVAPTHWRPLDEARAALSGEAR